MQQSSSPQAHLSAAPEVLSMLRAAELYYYEDQTHAQIAEQLGTSRWTVGRLLDRARRSGIVRITIEHPLARHHHLEVQLKEQFGMREAIVVPSQSDTDVTLQAVCRAAADHLSALRPRPQSLGVSWGRTTSRVAALLNHGWAPEVTVIQTNGGLALDGADHVGMALRVIAERGPGRARMMPAPTILQSAPLASQLRRDPAVATTLELAANARTIVFSPGSATSASVLVDSGYLDTDEVDRLQGLGVVGDVLSHFIDADGQVADADLDARTISISLDALRACPNAIAVVSGPEKAAVARAIMTAQLCTTIIIDAELASAALLATDTTGG